MGAFRSTQAATALQAAGMKKPNENYSLASALDLSGQRFSRLTVTERAGSGTFKGCTHAKWKCVCDCGTEKVALATNLKRGITKSCGCLAREKVRRPDGKSLVIIIMGTYKRHAKNRGYCFELSQDQFEHLIVQDCHYCGCPPRRLHKGHNATYGVKTRMFNGVDRKDNTQGYTTENAVPCCYFCNRAKGDSTLENFERWLGELVAFRSK